MSVTSHSQSTVDIATESTYVAEELEEHHAEIIRATLPLVGANIGDIAKSFYNRMFGEHPELLRNLFNRGNQAQGAQQRALAAAVATYASHLVNPDLPHPAELLSRIGHKHASLGIVPEQYPIVHKHLFAAIVEILGADVVSAEIAAAWDRVYWMMADTLIAMERDLYAASGVAVGDVYRRAVVIDRIDDPSGAVQLTIEDPRGPFPKSAPGQYVSVGVTLPDGARQLRQYSLINAPDTGRSTIAIKRDGEVSNWIAENVRAGDILDVTLPFGDLPADKLTTQPVVLISAGIGITPMVGFLEFLTAGNHTNRVQVLHADRSKTTHPLLEKQSDLISRLHDGSAQLWYADEGRGRMDLTEVDLPGDAEIFICGNGGFIQDVLGQLDAQSVSHTRIHSELFAPDEWLLP